MRKLLPYEELFDLTDNIKDEYQKLNTAGKVEIFGKGIHTGSVHLRPGPLPAGQQIEQAGGRKGHHRRAEHVAYILINIRIGDGGHQQRAGGHGRAPVPKKHAGQDGPAQQRRRQPGSPAQHHADKTHGTGRAEGCTGEEGHQAAEQKSAEGKGTSVSFTLPIGEDKTDLYNYESHINRNE